MKEEYLWDRSGSDPVVEKLEAALQSLAYKEMPAPRLPTPAAAIRHPKWSWIFEYRFALAAACIAVIGFGTYWMLRPAHRIVVDQADMAVEPVRPPIRSEITIAPPEAIIVSPPLARRKDVLSASVVSRARPVFVRLVHKPTRKKVPLMVTKEEALAYNQLMLALNITSSNLKIVKETISGTNPKGLPDTRER
jgi:hypothetical protein